MANWPHSNLVRWHAVWPKKAHFLSQTRPRQPVTPRKGNTPTEVMTVGRCYYFVKRMKKRFVRVAGDFLEKKPKILPVAFMLYAANHRIGCVFLTNSGEIR
jgi:hypothetical protein